MAKIDVKFNLGDEVFAFGTDSWGNFINRGKIVGISVDEEGREYLVGDINDFYKEEDLLSVDCTSEELYDKVYEMTEEE